MNKIEGTMSSKNIMLADTVTQKTVSMFDKLDLWI
jgi:hypothetical protein